MTPLPPLQNHVKANGKRSRFLAITVRIELQMIELNTEDTAFKKSKEYPGKKSLIHAARAIEASMFDRTIDDQDSGYNQRSTVGIIMSSFGWNGGIDGIAKNLDDAAKLRRVIWRKDSEDRHEYRQQVIYALSRYIVDRMTLFDRQHKTNEEIIDWLKRMAD